MRFTTFALVAMFSVLSAGCFDSSPPSGVAGELVGCITVDADLYCTTKYAGAGVEDATEVLIGTIDFDTSNNGFRNFNLSIRYQETGEREKTYEVLVESDRWEDIVGYQDPKSFKGAYIRIFPGDSVAVAILKPPTILQPHQGYIIANLTRPDVEFEIPDDVDDVDVLDLTP